APTCSPGSSSSCPIPQSNVRFALKRKRKNTISIIHRGPRAWLDALALLGTDENKPFIEIAPYLIVIFAESFGVLPDGRKVKHERPFLILVVGYPAEGATVPSITKKPLEAFATFV